MGPICSFYGCAWNEILPTPGEGLDGVNSEINHIVQVQVFYDPLEHLQEGGSDPESKGYVFDIVSNPQLESGGNRVLVETVCVVFTSETKKEFGLSNFIRPGSVGAHSGQGCAESVSLVGGVRAPEVYLSEKTRRPVSVGSV